MPRIFKFIAVLLSLSTVLGTANAQAEALQYFTASDESSTQIIDHSVWDGLLKKYIKADSQNLNRFDYAGVSAEDKASLERYIENLGGVSVTGLNKSEQRAYWINAYNAITVNLMLDNWPTGSIREIGSVFGIRAFGPWKRDIFEVEGQVISLDAIEHSILRPIWNDPRTHYAVNCASVGCPNLQDTAFTAANMESLLDRGAVDFINSPRGIQAFKGKKIRVSSIYKWFKEDFGSTDDNVIAHLKQYAKGDVARKLNSVTKISGDDYDWDANAQ